MKLQFGDLLGKAKAIEAHRRQLDFEAAVAEVMKCLGRLKSLPPLGRKVDYPPLVMRFELRVLEEANRRERARREL